LEEEAPVVGCALEDVTRVLLLKVLFKFIEVCDWGCDEREGWVDKRRGRCIEDISLVEVN